MDSRRQDCFGLQTPDRDVCSHAIVVCGIILVIWLYDTLVKSTVGSRGSRDATVLALLNTRQQGKNESICVRTQQTRRACASIFYEGGRYSSDMPTLPLILPTWDPRRGFACRVEGGGIFDRVIVLIYRQPHR